MHTALVLLSGGQDSTTALYWALNNFGGHKYVEALTFDYAQRHRIELESAAKIAHRAGVNHTLLPIDTFAALGGNALNSDDIRVTDGEKQGLPSTFVPGRNLIFTTFAAAYAYREKVHNIVIGVSQTDYSGYPDCRADTIQSLERTLCLGMEYRVTLHTPLMYISKAETVVMLREYGKLDELAWSHTCYQGTFPPCGECAACRLRAQGFDEAGCEDPLIQRARKQSN